AFGLARARLQADDGPGAVAVLTAVPDTSTHHLAAQVAAVRIQIMARRDQTKAAADDLRAAGGRIGRLKLDTALQEQLTAEVLRAALDSVASGAALAGGELLGCEPSERSLRFGLERSYRALARLAPDRRRRIQLVDMANDVRPRTWSLPAARAPAAAAPRAAAPYTRTITSARPAGPSWPRPRPPPRSQCPSRRARAAPAPGSQKMATASR